MQITSATKIVPIVFTDGSKVIIKAFAPEQNMIVHLYDSEYHKKGDVSGPINADKIKKSVVINCLADIDQAAKLALSARPMLNDEFPAAVLRYNPTFTHQDVMYWLPVNKLGQFQPYITTDRLLDVPENGAFLHNDCDTDRTRIFHSPVDAIAAAFDQTIKFIGNLRREVKAEEEKIQKQIAEKQALINRINKSQEI